MTSKKAAAQLTRTDLTRALVNLAARGGRPRCSDPDTHRYWLSDDQAERELAASWCAGCPISAECEAAADENAEAFGVWAGRDKTNARANIPPAAAP